MDNLNKGIYIYFIMLIVSSLFLIGGLSRKDSYILLVIEPILMISLFRIFRLNKKGIKVFMAIFTVLLMMIAMNSKALFNEYTNYGLYTVKPIIPFELIAVIALISLPFNPILEVIYRCGLIHKSIFIIPVVMIVLTYVSVRLAKEKSRKRSK